MRVIGFMLIEFSSLFSFSANPLKFSRYREVNLFLSISGLLFFVSRLNSFNFSINLSKYNICLLKLVLTNISELFIFFL